jgi:hypothetical protein
MQVGSSSNSSLSNSYTEGVTVDSLSGCRKLLYASISRSTFSLVAPALAATTVSVEKNLRASVTDMVPEMMMMEMIDVMMMDVMMMMEMIDMMKMMMIDMMKTMMMMEVDYDEMMVMMMIHNANKTIRFDMAY